MTKTKKTIIALGLFIAFIFVYSLFFNRFCGKHIPLSTTELQETIAQALAQEGNRTILFKLFSHYLALSKESDVYAFYRILYHDDYSKDYSKELAQILKDPSRLKRFIDDCSLDDFCASSDIYDHYYSVYQSLPDENKTAIEQAITQDNTEAKTESCGILGSIRKFFTCG